MRTVKNILESKAHPFNHTSPKTLVIDALRQLDTLNLSYLVVMEGNEYKGIFSERDYSRNVILKGRHSNSTTVEEAMTKEIPVVELTQTVEQCMIMMNYHKTRYLLAFDEERFAGVITIHDLLRQVISNKEDVFDRTLAQQLVDDEEGRIY
ncbi:MAG: CBS domain-containing protein [Bacteroidota bacterium]|nr:CBS domain-containing protein [Bacteroidota bacterium]